MTEDTIAAISTPLGEGGIAIVRMSGPRAFEIADAIFLSSRIEQAREQLLTIVAHFEAHIDFPDEDIAPDTRDKLLNDTVRVTEFLQQLLATAHDGKILRQGYPVTIVGRPNAGKSSLMNALLGEDRAIVTPVAGTTRDTIEEIANFGGLPVRLTDTAGIRS